jgi:glyoxylase-like metal-dependent hydrolase (beta-lactamase superfamily II)
MFFTLEVLEAKHGDALLLHYGTKKSPKLVVIDGGPQGVFDKSLRPRLEQLRDKRTPGAPLPVRLLMVSHIDDDHIRGVLDLTDHLLEQQGNEALLCDITTLWHNSFDEILGNNEADAIPASLGPSVKLASNGELKFPANLFRDEGAAAIAANVPQGRRLRGNAEALALLTNDPFDGLVHQRPKQKALDLGNRLKFRVVGPSQTRLEKLEKDWDKRLKALEKKKAAEAKALAAEFMDTSVYNLASIVVLAESGGKRILLTGDALADETMLEGLRESGLLKEGGTLHVDILKMPHHGSVRNVTEEFLRTVTADHYIMSANGKYDNPDLGTLKLFSKVRGNAACTVHLTNAVPHAVKFFDTDLKTAGKNYKVNIRQDTVRSLRIDLGEPFKD